MFDNAGCYPKIELPNVKLCFLPSNATLITQPLDQGHFRHDGGTCLVDEDGDLFVLKRPLINSSNFMGYYYIIINSIGECCTKMLQGTVCSEQVIKCLWGSLFNIVGKLRKADLDDSVQRITALLAVYVHMSKEDDRYNNYIIGPVCELLLEHKLFNIDITIFNTEILFAFVREVMKYNSRLFVEGNIILKVFRYSMSIDNRDIWFKKGFDVFCTVPVEKKNIKGLLTFWKECANILNNICQFHTGAIENVIQSTVLEFMVWPIQYMDLIAPEDYDATINVFSTKWGEIFVKIFETHARNSLVILEKLRNSIVSNTAANITELLPQFHPLLSVTSPNTDFGLHVLEACLNVARSQESITDVVPTRR